MNEKAIADRIAAQFFGRQYITPIIAAPKPASRRRKSRADAGPVAGEPSRHSDAAGTGICDGVESFRHHEAGPAFRWVIRPPATEAETAACYRQMLNRWLAAYDEAGSDGPDDHRRMAEYDREMTEIAEIADAIRAL